MPATEPAPVHPPGEHVNCPHVPEADTDAVVCTTGHPSTERARTALDHAVAQALPLAGGRVKTLLELLRVELAHADSIRARHDAGILPPASIRPTGPLGTYQALPPDEAAAVRLAAEQQGGDGVEA